MFGLFKRNKKDKRTEAAKSFALMVLNTQIALCEEGPKFGDSFFRGYMLGVCDAMAQGAGIKEDAKMAAFVVSVHSDIFGEKGEDVALKSFFKDQFEDQVFAKGRMLGGQETINALKDDDFIPMGLANYCS